MFVGLQGAGKTTSCMKYANYYKKKGFRVAMVCADTFRAGAYDQLKQNAKKIGVHYYGSRVETDAAIVASAGVAYFSEEKKGRRDRRRGSDSSDGDDDTNDGDDSHGSGSDTEADDVNNNKKYKNRTPPPLPKKNRNDNNNANNNAYDLIIVDTSGRHKQQQELFDEMKRVELGVKPDHVVFVMDGSIGQAARDHAEAFRAAVPIGSVIITKLDGHAKGGGALSAVTLAKAPIAFIGTGEHMDDLERFHARSFVQRLLGMGDMEGLFEAMTSESMLKAQRDAKFVDKLRSGRGTFTIRDMFAQLQMIMGLGDMGKLMTMIPGMDQLAAKTGVRIQDAQDKMKRYRCVMESMHPKELDGDIKIVKNSESRILRIARGAGVSVMTVHELFLVFNTYQPMFQKLINSGGIANMLTGAMGGGGGSGDGKALATKAKSGGPGGTEGLIPGGMGQLASLFGGSGRGRGGGGAGGGGGFDIGALASSIAGNLGAGGFGPGAGPGRGGGAGGIGAGLSSLLGPNAGAGALGGGGGGNAIGALASSVMQGLLGGNGGGGGGGGGRGRGRGAATATNPLQQMMAQMMGGVAPNVSTAKVAKKKKK